MNNFIFNIILAICVLHADRTIYWNLGVSINKERSKTIQQRIDLDNFLIEKAPFSKKTNSGNLAYTLENNYMIEPTITSIENSYELRKNKKTVKDLIINEEYFEAAKTIIKLNETNLSQEFNDMNEYRYWSGFVYYHLGNYEEAILQISFIENTDLVPETMFLEALILQKLGQKEKSSELLEEIIENYPHNDYSNYSENILKEIKQ